MTGKYSLTCGAGARAEIGLFGSRLVVTQSAGVDSFDVRVLPGSQMDLSNDLPSIALCVLTGVEVSPAQVAILRTVLDTLVRLPSQRSRRMSTSIFNHLFWYVGELNQLTSSLTSAAPVVPTSLLPAANGFYVEAFGLTSETLAANLTSDLAMLDLSTLALDVALVLPTDNRGDGNALYARVSRSAIDIANGTATLHQPVITALIEADEALGLVMTLTVRASLQLNLPGSQSAPHPTFNLLGSFASGQGALLRATQGIPWTAPLGLSWLELANMTIEGHFSSGALQSMIVGGTAVITCHGQKALAGCETYVPPLAMRGELRITRNVSSDSFITTFTAELPSAFSFVAMALCFVAQAAGFDPGPFVYALSLITPSPPPPPPPPSPPPPCDPPSPPLPCSPPARCSRPPACSGTRGRRWGRLLAATCSGRAGVS